ncbi:ABC transporter permease [Niveispirillum sp. BGYR6]|uniref:ABC transporter permease n=1 Tax=Niveispirillum sp. BGYR6 TaxID=2971249 RepID=UPI0022B98276|nr:ABC transporter permease [Niveispirillum sp. BGYR6]MDG5495791.1 ABC transporter permease [Niveispirillum sp. BGYR6]
MSLDSIASRPAGAFNAAINRMVPAFHTRAFLTLLGKEMRRVWKMAAMIIVAPALMAVIYFVCFLFGLGPQRGTPEGDAVLSFLVPGLVMLSILMRAAENTGFSLLYGKIEGHVLDQLMAPIGAREVVPAYAITGMSAGLVSGLFVWFGSLLIWPQPVAHPGLAVLFAALAGLLMAACGLLTGLASTKWDHMAAYFTFLFTPLSFLSGVFAPVAGMPPFFAHLVQSNPIFYAMDGFRYAMMGTSHQDPGLCALVVTGATALLYALAGRLYAIGWHMKN